MGLIDVLYGRDVANGRNNNNVSSRVRFGQRNRVEITLTLEADERIRIHVGNLIPVQFQRV